MAVNSFLIKGWVVTLTAAIFALSAKDANTKYILFAYFPIFIFWILDGYYLYQERLYRSLYNFVRKLDDSKIDFCLDATKYKNEKKNNWPSSIWSKTLMVFYISLIVVLTLLVYFLIYKSAK